MKKYLQIFKISFQDEFAYKMNFIMWRVRNMLQIFVAYFLWDRIFTDPGRVLFGYDRAKILTYVFMIMIVKALVLSARAIDVSQIIAMGDLSDYLVKPISYFKYWFTRDLSSKALNVSFAVLEFLVLAILFRPPIFIQFDPFVLIGFAASIIVAVMLYFFIIFIVSAVPFWAPELGWGSHFLVTVILIEFFSGALFPINILPVIFQNIILYLPFPYLIYFPIQVYLGQIQGVALLQGLMIGGFWIFALGYLMKAVWRRGLKAYEGVGR